MIVFILKYCAILASFILFYKLFLENESFHILKRFYLLLSPILAALIPLISFPEYVETSSALVSGISENIISIQKEPESNYNLIILWSIYWIGFTIMGIRFILNIYMIAKRIKQNPKHKQRNIINVLLKEPTIPHTFLNYIFLNKHKFNAQLIPEEVLLHEEAHVIQKHSLDILFVELLQIVFWFNPLVYLINKSIKLNHEFLADQAVINHGFNSNTYLETLLAFSSNAIQPKLANAINYSSIKKRFTIMKTQTSKFTSLIKGLVLLPLLGFLLYSFSDRTIVEISPNKDNVILSKQKKATPEQFAEYNKLAKHYNIMLENGEDVNTSNSSRNSGSPCSGQCS
ncbi:MAG: M56 family metallopeptidase [Flavobacteriaceae bacterium]